MSNSKTKLIEQKQYVIDSKIFYYYLSLFKNEYLYKDYETYEFFTKKNESVTNQELRKKRERKKIQEENKNKKINKLKNIHNIINNKKLEQSKVYIDISKTINQSYFRSITEDKNKSLTWQNNKNYNQYEIFIQYKENLINKFEDVSDLKNYIEKNIQNSELNEEQINQIYNDLENINEDNYNEFLSFVSDGQEYFATEILQTLQKQLNADQKNPEKQSEIEENKDILNYYLTKEHTLENNENFQILNQEEFDDLQKYLKSEQRMLDGIIFGSEYEKSVYIKTIKPLIKIFGIKVEFQYKYNKFLPLGQQHTVDFYIPSLNLLIEATSYKETGEKSNKSILFSRNYKRGIEIKENMIELYNRIDKLNEGNSEKKHEPIQLMFVTPNGKKDFELENNITIEILQENIMKMLKPKIKSDLGNDRLNELDKLYKESNEISFNDNLDKSSQIIEQPEDIQQLQLSQNKNLDFNKIINSLSTYFEKDPKLKTFRTFKKGLIKLEEEVEKLSSFMKGFVSKGSEEYKKYEAVFNNKLSLLKNMKNVFIYSFIVEINEIKKQIKKDKSKQNIDNHFIKDKMLNFIKSLNLVSLQQFNIIMETFNIKEQIEGIYKLINVDNSNFSIIFENMVNEIKKELFHNKKTGHNAQVELGF